MSIAAMGQMAAMSSTIAYKPLGSHGCQPFKCLRTIAYGDYDLLLDFTCFDYDIQLHCANAMAVCLFERRAMMI